MSRKRLLLLCAVAAAAALPAALAARPARAAADPLEPVFRTPTPTYGFEVPQTAPGAYVPLSTGEWDVPGATFSVLDPQTGAVSSFVLSRAELQPFGYVDATGPSPPTATVVSFDPAAGRAGLLLDSGILDTSRKRVFAEVDTRAQRIRRTVVLPVAPQDEVRLAGVEPHGRFLAYETVRYPGGGHGPSLLRAMRMDLATFAHDERVRITLPARADELLGDMRSYGENRAMTRLAFVEYTESGAVVPGPAPSVYVIDTDARAAFQVPAAETMYGVAFSADDRFLYLASHERGEIRRVDVAAKRVDMTKTGVPSVQHIVVSNDGTRLVGILMDTATYVSYDLPDLSGRKTFASPAALAKLKWFFGDGASTLDGRFFLLPDEADDAPRTISVFRVRGA